jgi:arylsulfatase A
MLLVMVAAGGNRACAADPKRPNIVFILGDDYGIDGVGCYGSDRAKTLTPNLDALARSGTRFDRCYSTPLCGPSRCLLMTGRYGFRTGGLTNQSAGQPSYYDEPSLASILKQAGYATGMAGKWRQMADSPGDWGFGEYITDPTAAGWYWRNRYTKNGQEVTSDKTIYYPDVASDFAVDFLRQHHNEPFYFYLAEHLIHGPIVRTPDSKPDAGPRQLYDDNIVYLDKTVGKIVTELEKLGLRERTLIVFAADNGTSRVGYTPQHDPDKTTGKIGGRAVHGQKGQVLEGGSRVPLIASWQGTMPAGRVLRDLIDFSDLLPTFVELAGGVLPTGVKFDGRSFAPQLRGEKGNPRDWIFVQLGPRWYARNDSWKLNQAGELFSMQDAPFIEAPVVADSSDPDARAARKQLQAALDELNPAGGKTTPPDEAKPKRMNRRKQPRPC